MADKHYLDNDGALYLVQNLKSDGLDKKVDKVDGKGLSTNDYTTTEKDKLAAIEEQANKTTINNTVTSDSTSEALSAAQGKYLKGLIDDAVQAIQNAGGGDMTQAVYDTDGNGIVDNASQLEGHSASYFAKATDLDDYLTKTGDASNVTNTFTVAASRVNLATGEKLSVSLSKIAKYFSDLATVAFSGSYNDLSDKPTIPTVTNDLTDELKAHYDAAYTHSTTTHAPATAEENVIDTIKVNGTEQTVSNKAVNITVPTTVASLSDADNYALKSDISNVYKYKGSVAAVANLPSSGNTAGDVYNVEADGMNYAWTGSEWDALGATAVEITSITNSEIDTIFSTVFGS